MAVETEYFWIALSLPYSSLMTIEARAEISLLKLCLARRNSTESQ